MNTVNMSEIRPGDLVQVEIADCCVTGVTFTAIVTAVSYDEEYGDSVFGFTFDNHVTVRCGANRGVRMTKL